MCINFISYPFDWNHPSGYIVCIIIQILSQLALDQIHCITLLRTIEFCLFITDFVYDVREKLRQLNTFIRTIKHKNNMTNKEHMNFEAKLTQIIQFYSDAREYSVNNPQHIGIFY